MCWAMKCCFLVPLDWACLLLGTGSFIVSAFLALTSFVLFITETHQKLLTNTNESQHYLQTILHLDLNTVSIHIILSIIMLLSVLCMLFSAMLVIGVKKNIPSLVLSYFAYGIVLTIVLQLGALLELLQKFWIVALVKFIASLIYIHFLVVVHTVYELMQRGKHFGFSRHRSLDGDPIIE